MSQNRNDDGLITRLQNNNYSISKTLNFHKEHLAAGALIFTDLRRYLLVLLPIFMGLTSYMLTSTEIELPVTPTSISLQQTQMIINLSIAAKFTLVLLISYLGIIRFQSIKKQGDYGYWLALGVDRVKFLFYILFGFTLNAFFSTFLTISIIFVFFQLYISIGQFLLYILIILSSSLLLCSILFFLLEIFENIEITLMVTTVIYGLFIFFVGRDNPLRRILMTELYFTETNVMLFFLAQIILSVLGIFITWKFHVDKDIQLGG